MRLSTLSTVTAVMMVLLWMLAVTWRPHGLYADAQPKLATESASSAAR